MIKDFVKKKLLHVEKGHDYQHALRVEKYALILQSKEGGDKNIIKNSALIHDVIDSKFTNESKALEKVKKILKQNKIKNINEIINIIKNISFRKKYKGKKSLEFQIVQDADMLDAIGAIAIARSFHFGGYKNRPLHDPNIKIDPNYKETTTINHFHEKLLLLKDRLNTKTAKKIAESKHQFMLKFLEEFQKDWDVEY
tara:strand:- start:36 stop:626 length:591 start_codon:yes stop_codon:yes gene_type:complete